MWRHVVGLLFLLLLCLPVCGADGSGEKIRVITYNVQFLPGLASIKNERPNPEYRAERIAEEVSRFDIIGLQETFTTKYRKQILQRVEKNWDGEIHSLRSPTPKGFVTSGGCLAVSRWPIVASNAVVFENFSTPAKYGLGADGYAAKGVIHARIANQDSPGEQFDIFVTHLESKADDMRLLQYVEMAAFIKMVSAVDRPAIILGDMNTRGAKEFREDPKSQYSLLTEQLKKARPGCELIDVWAHLKGDALGGTNKQESHKIGKRIDCIFVSNPPAPNAQLRPVSVEVRLFQDPKVTALSDHNAVIAELVWQQP